MTRYLCTDATHRKDGTMHAVDVTAQVRLERELLPRPLGYLAWTERVVEDVIALDEGYLDARQAAVTRILTGTDAPVDAPVILAAERAVTGHGPGLYELDDVRAGEPAIDRLFRDGGSSGTAGASDQTPPLYFMRRRNPA